MTIEQIEQHPPVVMMLKVHRSTGGTAIGHRETKQVIRSKKLLKELDATAKRDLQKWLDRYAFLDSFLQESEKGCRDLSN